MKKLIMISMLFIAMAIAEDPVQAQGLYTPSTTGYVLGDTSRMVKVYGPFQASESVRVGVYYTKGASEDTLSTVNVYHALDNAILTAGYGSQVSVDSLLQFDNPGASEYKEQVISFTGGINYIGIEIDPASTATDTTNIKPLVYVK